jgi:O-antigen/teichoic acid export membrane protein
MTRTGPTSASEPAPPETTPPVVPDDEPPVPASPLLHDALVTIVTRFGLALVIFGTDILLARLLLPAAKGRFTLALLTSQTAALIVGWGMDSALGVIARRDRETARRGLANAILWSAVVGGFAVVVACWAYGIPTEGRPHGPLASVIPNLSAQQFVFSAVALPGELFFSIGLFALLGRGRVISYSVIRFLRRASLFVLVLVVGAIAWVSPDLRFSLDLVLVVNLVALALTVAAILWVARKDGTLSARPSMPLLVEELRFGSRAIVGTIAERLQFRSDAFLVNLLVGVKATGIYSVTSGLAETLWYVPNALGLVMFSRAVDPKADSGSIAAVLTRTTIAVTFATAIPAYLLGPQLVRVVYGSQFADAGVALRLILPGVVLYSIVAILSRYIVGRGRPGTGTLLLLTGLAANVVCNLVLIPRFGIVGAAASSSISYGLTALATLAVFLRMSGRGWRETLILRRSDIVALVSALVALRTRLAGGRGGPLIGLRGGDTAAEIIIGEREPGDEP